MDGIANNIKKLRNILPENVSMVAVSKTRSSSEILQAYNAGQRIFGENRVQELILKEKGLPADIQWHLIGHLQSNKVRQIVPIVSMIESVDSLRLLSVINSEASRCGRVIDCLLQVHIATEETKFGFDYSEIADELWGNITSTMKYVRICGLMGMASFTDDHEKVRDEFRSLKILFDTTRNKCFSNKPWFNVLSMGMSGDWKIAVEEGSTMIRVGTLIFGERINKIK